jgi:hypothetical protein
LDVVHSRLKLGKMDLDTFRLLLTPIGQEALEYAEKLAPREVDFLGHFQKVARRYPRELARLALETAILRSEASEKFPWADRMYFTRQALEQASSHAVSSYRVERYRPFKILGDLACSLGGDTISLAKMGLTVGVDLDPMRLALAQANLKALNLVERVTLLQADLTASMPLSPSPDLAMFFDPSRRKKSKRITSVRSYLPPLQVVKDWLPRFPAVGVKISPGVRYEEISVFDAEVEFISLKGGLKEALLWFGPLKTCRRRATILPGAHTLYSEEISGGSTKFDGERKKVVPVSQPQAFLYEPDPAVIRAGLVEALGVRLRAAQLDTDIAYLTAEKGAATPFARSWAVENWFPFGLKKLRTYLRERKIGRVVVKKRGSPLEPEGLIRDLRLEGDGERVIFLTHLRGKPIVVVCHPERKEAL